MLCLGNAARTASWAAVPHVAKGGGVSEGPSQLRQHVPFTNIPCSSNSTP